MDKLVSTVEARNNFGDLINRASYGKERLILTRRGKKIAALVPVEDLEIIEAIEDRIDLDDARKALDEAAREGTVAWDSIKKGLGL